MAYTLEDDERYNRLLEIDYLKNNHQKKTAKNNAILNNVRKARDSYVISSMHFRVYINKIFLRLKYKINNVVL